MNFQRKKHIPKSDESVICSVIKDGAIDKNEVNTIKNIVQCSYSKNNNSKSLSDMIAEEICAKLQGEWFVFVCAIDQDIPFTISTVNSSDFLIIKMGSSKFIIARIK